MGMAGMFRPYAPDQQFLLPPSPQDWLPDGHLAYFIADTVDHLDLSSIIDSETYRVSGSGNPPYHPAMMLKLLIYAYCSGVFASRRIAKRIHEDIAFRVLAAGHFPGFRSIGRFRKDHIEAFQDLFVQVVQIAKETGLVKMGQVSIDGSKIKANASKHKAMSYARMQEVLKKLRKEIESLTKAAADADELDDKEFGEHFDGNDIPGELARRKDRLKAIQKAKRELEARKREEAANQKAEAKAREEQGKAPTNGKKKSGTPKPKDQINFTDSESRIMKSGNGFEQSFNVQIAVDDAEQVLVAAEVTQESSDVQQLLPVLDAASKNVGSDPDSALADAGYLSEENLEGLEDRAVEGFLAIGRKTKNRKISDDRPLTQQMQKKLKTKRGAKQYAKRKHKVEAPFGWIKRCMGFRSFSLRGVANVRGEFALVCLAMNLRRLTERMAW